MFTGDGLSVTNPVNEVEREASDLWCGDQGNVELLVKCFISIGVGTPDKKEIEDSVKVFSKMSKVIATDSEMTERRFRTRSWLIYDAKRYFRFNIEKGLPDVGPAEYSEDGYIAKVVDEYLTHSHQRFLMRDCVRNLRMRQGMYILYFT